MLSTEQVVIGNVTFEPGCRKTWHIHHATSGGGQLLLVTAGRGYYQEWGNEARAPHPQDVVHIPAGVKHWHGAAPDSWFQHLAVEVPGDNCRNEWCEAVSDEAYRGNARDRRYCQATVLAATGGAETGMTAASAGRRLAIAGGWAMGWKFCRRYSLKNAQETARIMNNAGYDVVPVEMDLSSRESILSMIPKGRNTEILKCWLMLREHRQARRRLKPF